MKSLTSFSLALVGAALVAGCSGGASPIQDNANAGPNGSDGTTSGAVGTVSFDLSLPANFGLQAALSNSLHYILVDSAHNIVQTGTANIANTTYSFQLSGIPAGSGYEISLAATTANGTQCAGSSAAFAVTARTTTHVRVDMACNAKGTDGGTALVNGNLYFCGTVTSVATGASGGTANVGDSINLVVTATGPDTNGLTYSWQSSNEIGTFGANDQQGELDTTTFTCTSPGTATLTVVVGDGAVPDGDSCASDQNTATIDVTCVGSTGGSGGQNCGALGQGCCSGTCSDANTGCDTSNTCVSCPAPPEPGLALHEGFPLAFPSGLRIFNVYWDSNWDNDNPGFNIGQIDVSTQALLSTTYFGKLRLYGVPQFDWAGSTNTNRFLQPCLSGPGASTNFLTIMNFLQCEESSPSSGVPFAGGVPNPACAFCDTVPEGCLLNPACFATPNPTGDIIYNIFLPKGTVEDDPGRRSCRDYGAYHMEIPSGALAGTPTWGRPLMYTVIPADCFGSVPEMMGAVAHELVEAATDPLPLAHWLADDGQRQRLDPSSTQWLLTQGEAADECAGTPPVSINAQGVPLQLPAYWSNADSQCTFSNVVAQTAPPAGCPGNPLNACGGPGPLAGATSPGSRPGDSCGACPAGVFECSGTTSLSCTGTPALCTGPVACDASTDDTGCAIQQACSSDGCSLAPCAEACSDFDPQLTLFGQFPDLDREFKAGPNVLTGTSVTYPFMNVCPAGYHVTNASCYTAKETDPLPVQKVCANANCSVERLPTGNPYGSCGVFQNIATPTQVTVTVSSPQDLAQYTLAQLLVTCRKNGF
jgi:hypothetical protein